MPIEQPTNDITLSGELLSLVEQYAQQHGMTTEEALTALVRSSLHAKYVRQRQPAKVVQLRPRQ